MTPTDIAEVRGTIGTTLKATEKELSDRISERDKINQTIEKLESDHQKLVELNRVVGPSSETATRRGPKPGAKRGPKPGKKRGPKPKGAAASVASVAETSTAPKRRGRPPGSGKKAAASNAAPKTRAASKGGKTMPESDRIVQILGYIDGQNGKATRSGITSEMGLSQPRVQQLIAKMGADKLISNTPNPENKVQKFITLTPNGEKKLAKG